MNCPCGSKLAYQDCCGQYIEKGKLPPTAEALMRSRYVAYVFSNISYIVKTMRGQPLEGYNVKASEQWSKSVKWRNLRVLNIFPEKITENHAFVEFKATFNEKGINKTLHECSEFKKEGEQWFYVDGEIFD